MKGMAYASSRAKASVRGIHRAEGWKHPAEPCKRQDSGRDFANQGSQTRGSSSSADRPALRIGPPIWCASRVPDPARDWWH